MSSGRTPDTDLGTEIPRRTAAGPAPLSFAQELLWLMDRAQPGLSAWNVPRALRLRGALDVDALQVALDQVVARHEVLRTVFASVDGEPRQIVRPATSVPIARSDVSELGAAGEAVAQLAREHALTPFDLSSDPLLRALLIRVAPEEHVLCLNSHHIVSDGWSKSVMFRELSALYRAARRKEAASLPALPIQFSDYAAWERDARHEAALAAPLAYWREKLAGPLPTLAIPTDFRAGVVPTFEGARRVAVLPTHVVDRARELATSHDATLYMVLLATYVAMLHRLSGQTDIVVGSPIVGRTQPETEDLIGYFANTLVLRNQLDGDPTFSELIERVRDTAFGAYEHQDVPFEKLVLELQRGQSLSHAPLFEAVLTMEDTVPGALELDGLTVESIPMSDGATKFALTMLVAQQPDGLRLALWYRTDLFAPATVDRMVDSFQRLLEAAVANPDQRIGDASLLSQSHRRELLAIGTGTPHRSAATVPDRFLTAVRRTPDATAVRSGQDVLSYAELYARARALAARLGAAGVRRGDTVALVLDRSPDLMVAVIGTWLAGAAYLPIAADTPAARVGEYLATAGASAVVVSSASRSAVPDGCVSVDVGGSEGVSADYEPARPVSDDAAYVLFTSGSTGAPKGVRVTHANLAHYTDAMLERLALPDWEPLTFASVSPLGADLGNTSVFPAIATGGTIDLVPDDVARDSDRFARYIADHRVGVLKITPGHLQALIAGRSDAELRGLLPSRWLITGGEALSWDLADRVLRAGACRLLNHYGPTETTVGACTFEVTSTILQTLRAHTATVPIGAPLDGVRCYVLDERRRLLPRGVVGELFIGGDGVADGYVGRDDLTRERFVEDPFDARSGGRMYATGDRVRWLSTLDALEFLGRGDDQLKVRGYRVELAEVEHMLLGHASVASCAVVGVAAEGAVTGSADRLVAFVVADRASGYAAAHGTARAGVDPATLAGWLRERLPEYMVPDTFVAIDALPLGPNGKIDRRALASRAIELDTDGESEAFVQPSTETEVTIAGIWQDVLQRDRIGATDSFLELGGHSLLAIRVLGRLSKQFGVRLPLRTLFESPTIRALGVIVDDELRAIEQRELDKILATLEKGDRAGDASQAAATQPERTTR